MTNLHKTRFIDTEIEIRVPPEQVWRAWTVAEEFIAWWGEDGKYRTTEWTGDLRTGGKWRSGGLLANGKPFSVEGTYLVVDPPHRLSFTWRHDWDDLDDETIVSIELERTERGTLLKLSHAGFRTDESCNDHRLGWTQVLGWLLKHLDSEKNP